MNGNTMKTNELVYGHGTNDLDEPVRHLKFYSTWTEMVRRCYAEESLSKHRTYVGCSVCSSWLSLSTFKTFFDANYREGMSLDKDVLIQGNKVYSPERCRFVPQYINSLLTDAGASRGSLPLGVTAVKSKNKNGQITTAYRAQCWDGHGGRPNSTFKTVPEAVAWYSIEKKKVVKDIVLESFWRNEILSDVATALLEREW